MNHSLPKYEFTGETKIINPGPYEFTVHRIRALRDFGDVKRGEVGGWIEDVSNLSHDGNCWVSDDARVTGFAVVCGNATVSGSAVIAGRADIQGNASVRDKAFVSGAALVAENATICGSAMVTGSVCVFGNATVCGKAYLSGEHYVFADSVISREPSSRTKLFGDKANIDELLRSAREKRNAANLATKAVAQPQPDISLSKADFMVCHDENDCPGAADGYSVYFPLVVQGRLYQRLVTQLEAEWIKDAAEKLMETSFYATYEQVSQRIVLHSDFKYYESGYHFGETTEIPLTAIEEAHLRNVLNDYCINIEGVSLQEYAASELGIQNNSLADKISSAADRAGIAGQSIPKSTPVR